MMPALSMLLMSSALVLPEQRQAMAVMVVGRGRATSLRNRRRAAQCPLCAADLEPRTFLLSPTTAARLTFPLR
jgi:hypothetical protein